MRQTLNFASGIVLGALPLFGAALIGLSIYPSVPQGIGILVLVILALAAKWIGFYIFRRVSSVGPIELWTASGASPELDNLQPTENSPTRKLQAADYAQRVNQNAHLCKGGSIRIFGDWLGSLQGKDSTLESAEYNSAKEELRLLFAAGYKLEISHPTTILEAASFVKVIDAKSIVFTGNLVEGSTTISSLIYKREAKSIATEIQGEVLRHDFDISLGDPALMIYA